MEKIYDASGDDKEKAIIFENWDRAYRKRNQPISLSDFVLVGITNQFPNNGIVKPQTTYWTLNGLANTKIDETFHDFDYVIIEPLEEQLSNPSLSQIHETYTYFGGAVNLSKNATILMSLQKYQQLCSNPEQNEQMKSLDLALYVGNQDLATKMLLDNKDFIWFDLDRYGYLVDDQYDEVGEIARKYRETKRVIIETMRALRKRSYEHELTEEITHEQQYDDSNKTNVAIVSGLSRDNEGDVELDEDTHASISIGKKRKNQEDAVLLVKDPNNPKLKMMVVADGMGGEENGELASEMTVRKLKEWFESLSEQEREYLYTETSEFEKRLKQVIKTISLEVCDAVMGMGGSTLVCAIIGQKNTLIANVGDSRAYTCKGGKLEQVSNEDSVVQEELEKGNIPYKDAMRFHRESNVITQCIGEREIKNIHFNVLKNSDYDILLLFSDGITDCLSDDEIAVICRCSDKKELAKRIVRHASIHDSIAPEELLTDYVDFNGYVRGGKDNGTVAISDNREIEEER